MIVLDDRHAIGINLVAVSAEGRVERQKLNQTTSALLSFGCVLGVYLDSLENT